MKINGTPYRTIWPTADNTAVEIIDQTKLPHIFTTLYLETMRDVERAIKDMQVRGAPLIGVTAAYGVAMSMRHHASDAALKATLRQAAAGASDGGEPALGCGENARAAGAVA